MKQIFIFILFLFFSTLGFTHPLQYSIIIDASDTGSRLHLYAYEKSQKLPRIKEIYTDFIDIDLASFADNPQGAGPSLEKILGSCDKKIKQLGIDTVAMNIMGTANMRLLPEQKQNKIYDSVKNYIREHYEFRIDKFETLAGRWEGIYDWLTANYLADTFQTKQFTFGILAVKNLSTEIAYELFHSTNSEDETNVVINGRNHIVFSKSFLGLGQDVVRNLIKKDSLANKCYTIGYPLKPDFKGDFDIPMCASIYNKELKKFPLSIVPFKGELIAFANAARIFNFLSAETSDRISFESRLFYACTLPWDLFQLEYSDLPKSELPHICANAVYVDQVIYDGFKLASDQFWVTSHIDKQALDWPLGMILYSLVQ